MARGPSPAGEKGMEVEYSQQDEIGALSQNGTEAGHNETKANAGKGGK